MIKNVEVDKINQTYFSNIRSDMAQFLPDNYFKILEVGCGEGEFIKNINKNIEYWGIEPSDAYFSAELKLYRVFKGTYLEVCNELPNNYFDLIICNDVIEHMVNCEEFFDSIKMKMSQKSYIIGSVPNVRHLSNLYNLIIKKDWMYKDYGILDKTHLRFFTKKSLLNFLNKNGFIVERYEGINFENINFLSFKSIVSFILYKIMGEDTKYIQYAFRCRKQ